MGLTLNHRRLLQKPVEMESSCSQSLAGFALCVCRKKKKEGKLEEEAEEGAGSIEVCACLYECMCVRGCVCV